MKLWLTNSYQLKNKLSVSFLLSQNLPTKTHQLGNCFLCKIWWNYFQCKSKETCFVSLHWYVAWFCVKHTTVTIKLSRKNTEIISLCNFLRATNSRNVGVESIIKTKSNISIILEIYFISYNYYCYYLKNA